MAMVPMLNTRKPPGMRGEMTVAGRRAKARGGRGPGGRTSIPPSALMASPRGGINIKRFGGAGSSSTQPYAALPFMGGLQPFRFGD